MEHQNNSFFIIKQNIRSLNHNDFRILDKEDKKEIKNLIRSEKPTYLLKVNKVDETHYLCLSVHTEKIKHSIQVTDNNDETIWIRYTRYFKLPCEILDPINLDIIISDFQLKDLYSNQKHHAQRKEISKRRREKRKKQEAIQKAKEAEIARKRNIEDAKKRRKRKAYEKKLRETAMKDPRYYADDGVIKCNSGHISKYKSYATNDWRNINAPVSAGRGNF